MLLDPVALALVLARSPQGGQGLDVLGVGGSSEGGRLGPLRGQRPRGQREVDAWDAVVVDAIDAAVFLAVGCEFGGEEAAVVGGWFPAEVVADGEGLLERHGPGVVRPGPKPGHGLLNRQNEEVSHGTVLSLGCLMSG